MYVVLVIIIYKLILLLCVYVYTWLDIYIYIIPSVLVYPTLDDMCIYLVVIDSNIVWIYQYMKRFLLLLRTFYCIFVSLKIEYILY